MASRSDFVWLRVNATAPKKRPNRSNRGCEFGRDDFASFREHVGKLGLVVSRLVRGHDHVPERFEAYERFGANPVLTLNTMCRALDDEPGGPEHLFREYHPTTWPGARLPHIWLENAVAVQDLIGPGYTLLRLGGTGADDGKLEEAFRARGVPFATLDIAEQKARDIYGYDLILLRPDMHVVWRGKQAPEDAAALAAMVTGH